MTDNMRTLDSMPSMAGLLPGLVKSLFRKGGGGVLPQDTFQIKNIAIDTEHLAAYQKVCQFEKSNQLPLTYLHVLAFKLQLSMLLDDDCEYPLLGLVHIENEITRHKALLASDTYEFRCRFAPVGEHKKGKLITLLLEAYVDGELVWEDRSTNLCRMPNPGYDSSNKPDAEGLAIGRRPLNNQAERWRLGADLGRRYASVSGDRNPIHLWKATAKMLGFKRQIVHGMWSKGRVCAAVEPGLGDGPVRVRCEFKQPIFLPGKVHFYRGSEKNSELVEIWDTQGARPHMVARFDPL